MTFYEPEPVAGGVQFPRTQGDIDAEAVVSFADGLTDGMPITEHAYHDKDTRAEVATGKLGEFTYIRTDADEQAELLSGAAPIPPKRLHESRLKARARFWHDVIRSMFDH